MHRTTCLSQFIVLCDIDLAPSFCALHYQAMTKICSGHTRRLHAFTSHGWSHNPSCFFDERIKMTSLSTNTTEFICFETQYCDFKVGKVFFSIFQESGQAVIAYFPRIIKLVHIHSFIKMISKLTFITWTFLLQVVFSATWFELRLIRFDNPSGRESDGDCCDFPCVDPCDPDIVICFDKP